MERTLFLDRQRRARPRRKEDKQTSRDKNDMLCHRAGRKYLDDHRKQHHIWKVLKTQGSVEGFYEPNEPNEPNDPSAPLARVVGREAGRVLTEQGSAKGCHEAERDSDPIARDESGANGESNEDETRPLLTPRNGQGNGDAWVVVASNQHDPEGWGLCQPTAERDTAPCQRSTTSPDGAWASLLPFAMSAPFVFLKGLFYPPIGDPKRAT